MYRLEAVLMPDTDLISLVRSWSRHSTRSGVLSLVVYSLPMEVLALSLAESDPYTAASP